MDKKRFIESRDKIIENERQRNGIGTLSEKTLHAVLKNYMENNEDYHEVPIDNYVADIYINNKIIEIQTGNFDKMRSKLDHYLKKEYEVKIVYPVPREKTLIMVDGDTGERISRRKSPLKGSPYMIFPELYKIKKYLKNTRLHFKIVMIDLEEFRALNINGTRKRRKKNFVKMDVFPTDLVKEIDIDRWEDLIQLIPFELENDFTSKEFANAAKIGLELSRVTLNIMYYMGVVERTGKKGNNYLYRVME